MAHEMERTKKYDALYTELIVRMLYLSVCHTLLKTTIRRTSQELIIYTVTIIKCEIVYGCWGFLISSAVIFVDIILQ